MVFFRNDDVGQDHPRFMRLATLFARHSQKLNGAAVPTACQALSTGDRFLLQTLSGSLELHVHGFRHESYQPASEKKAEYGSARTSESVTLELRQGRQIISQLFPEFFYPAFTPPWNRIADEFLPLLPANGYQLLSRFTSATARGIPLQAPIAELNVSIDLHTSKTGEVPSVPALVARIVAAEASGEILGIMLHHGKMSGEQFAYIDSLLSQLSERGIRAKYFSELEKNVRLPLRGEPLHAPF